MEEDSRRHRHRRRRRSRIARIGAHDVPTGGLCKIHDLADDLLELILLHIPSPVAILRAGATCRRWRRLITATGFLRRLPRSLQSPRVLGHYFAGAGTSFVPKPPPSPAPAADEKEMDHVRDLASRRLILLPDYDMGTTDLTDCRGGLLAFVRCDSSLVVYDPWAWRYREVYFPAATSPASERFSPCLGAFFLDADTAAGTTSCLSMINFRVLCVRLVSDVGHGERLTLTAKASVFLARDNRWVSLNSTVLEEQDTSGEKYVEPYDVYRFIGRMEGSLVWYIVRGGKVIHLDESSGDFSTFTLPAPARPPWDRYLFMYERWNLRVVGGRDDDGAMRLARIVGSDLEVLRCVSGEGGGKDVMVERTANLSQLVGNKAPPGLPWCFSETTTEEAVPAGSVVVSPSDKFDDWVFTIDVDAMELKRVGPNGNLRIRRLLPYELPWPPPIKRVDDASRRHSVRKDTRRNI